MGNGEVIQGGKPGDIVMLVVVEKTSILTVAESALYSNANSAWYQQPANEVLPMWLDGVVLIEAATLAKAKAKPMQVLYAEYKGGNEFEIITRLTNPGTALMRDTYYAVLTKKGLPAEAELFQPDEEKKLGLGFGLIDINIPDFLPNLSPLLWLLIAAGAAYGTYQAKPITSKIAFGAATWIASAKFVKTNTLKFKL